MADRLYSVEDVNALIPRLEVLMGKLQQRGLELRGAIEEVLLERDAPDGELSVAELLEVRPGLAPVVGEIGDLLRDIESSGGQFKGLDLGLVDFPAEIDGEIVLLCWQYGEKEVAFYHSFEGGFAARQRLKARRPSTLQ